MKAFHNDIEIKKKYLARVIHHQKMDHLIRGQGWTGEKGCAVGCTLENYDHSRYPIELGVPEWLARVEDTLFEGMNEEKSKTYPEEFLSAINVGADLENIKTKFIIMVLKSSIDSMHSCKYDEDKNPEVKAAIEKSTAAVFQMIEAREKGLDLSAARSAARSAAWSARSAARSAAWSATWSAWSATWSAESATWSAESATWSAESAAESAESATWSAESAARSAAWSARSAARSAVYDYFADELLILLKECK